MSRIYLPALLAASIAALAAQKPAFTNSERLEKLVRETAASAIEHFGNAGLTADKIAITVIDLADPKNPARASYRGKEPTYPASVVKLFYLAAAYHQMEAGALARTPQLERALHDMIVDSSNDATHFVVDMLTGTTAGPELSDAALRDWMDKRNLMNRYFAALGYEKINVDQKPWCEGPYGRERQGLGPNFENRNRLTTDTVARLWYEIVTGRAASPTGTHQMMNLLHRDPFTKSEDPDDQATAHSENRCLRARNIIRRPDGPPTQDTTPPTFASPTAPNTSWRSLPWTTASRQTLFPSSQTSWHRNF
ncbi:MAG: hypothetical protein JWO48_2575 [Bryobacterales bacterium]|nr:hypothetical protein [Bryobacterales bacterium]